MKNPPTIPSDVIQSVGLLWASFALRAFRFDLAGSLLGYAVLIYAPLWWERKGGDSVKDLLGPGEPVRAGLIGLLAGVIACALFGAGWKLIGGHFPWVGQLENPDFTRLISSSAVGSILLFPLAEEFFFRGYVQKRLTDSDFSPLQVNLIQAAMFGFTHVISFMSPAGFLTFIPGLIMGELRRRCRNLAAPGVFHAISNAFVLVF